MDEFKELLKKFDDGYPTRIPILKGKVLIIDDDPNIRQGLERTLVQKNYEVFIATTGHEGLDAISEEFCVVILDVKLPKMDGIETYELLKLKQPDIPIIFFSAYPGDESKAKKCLDLQPYAFIEKGVSEDIEKLYKLIEDAAEEKDQNNE